MSTREPHPLLTELRAERKDRGLTQGDIAAVMGTSISGVSVIETGVKGPYLDTVVRYADALGYDLTLTPKPTPPQRRPSRPSPGTAAHPDRGRT